MKYIPPECVKGKKKLSFADCELAILRTAVDKVQSRSGKKMLHSAEVKQIIEIVEKFLRTKKRICYGGTAINNILPEDQQFYNKQIELPDYDFFSPQALKDAKDLADIYVKEGFTDVEAKSGVHPGTFKVFVNFIPIADITSIPKDLYNVLLKKAKERNGIKYAPPDYLRMAMYLELSRPQGDTSRWEKVLKRLILLNKAYPLRGHQCDTIEVQRMFDDPGTFNEKNLFYTVRDTLINQGVIFFGGFANRMYLKYHHFFKKKQLLRTPDFDVLSTEPKVTATIVKEELEEAGFKKIHIQKRKPVGEIISESYEVKHGNEILVVIYAPLGCHSYNVIRKFNRNIRIATIDTMLSFYLAFLYANRPYYNPQRILCMSQFLFQVQKYNRLKQRGILRRFSINCYGKQATLESMRQEKEKKYKQLKNKRNSKEYEYYFLNYKPGVKKTRKKRRKRRKRRKTRRRGVAKFFNL
jgi:hypothetical protein